MTCVPLKEERMLHLYFLMFKGAGETFLEIDFLIVPDNQ